MAVDHEELYKSEFWQRKLRTVDRIRDINKDGFISRADFMILGQRYKDMGSSEQHLKKLDASIEVLCMAIGLTDDSIKRTHEELVETFRKSKTNADDISKIFSSVFEVMDSDGNGVISFKEWTDYYSVTGIDTKYARASFDAMDTNGDGIFSKEEFYAYNKEFYYSTEDKLNSSIMYGPLDD